MGDGFFATFERPAAAVECAIAIQRELAEDRRTTGFAGTASEAGDRFAAFERRTVNLKGISSPLEVVAIDWR